MKPPSRTRLFLYVALSVSLMGGVFFFFSGESASVAEEEPASFPITLALDGLELPGRADRGETVGRFLERAGIPLGERDFLAPRREVTLSPRTAIVLAASKRYTIKTKGGATKGETTLQTIGQLLDEKGIPLDEDDLVTPAPERALRDGDTIAIVRVDIREERVEKPIPFETKESEDSALSWRKRIVTQKGVAGLREIRSKIVSHDGKLIKKTLIENRVVREPVTEIVTQGTKVEVGKKHTGLGSWYRFTGTLSAANPWLPIGSYVRVTNVANGKSVIVRINDRGPFGPNRIIDLDAVAFERIASLGAGIIEVKMEEIRN